MPRDRRGLRDKSRRDADDRAVERARAEAAKERAAREAALEAVNTDINSLEAFRDRPAGFAAGGHDHGPDAIQAVHWSRVGTGKSPVPRFATKGDLAALRRWVKLNFRPLA